MADVHSVEVRSYNMSRIKSKNTKPEILLRKLLFANGFRFRLHDKLLPGKPDIILKKYKTIIFVHGCFWHGHKDCKYFILPKTRSEWWSEKIGKNRVNDQKSKISLELTGWKVIEVFECELKKSNLESTLTSLITAIKDNFVQNH